MTPLLELAFGLACYSPLRVVLLRILGASIGDNCVIHPVRFINFYRGSFRNLIIGDDGFIGDDVLLDLAGPISIGHQVTLAARVSILTHLNVGYEDHPLQKRFPGQCKGVKIGSGSFIGTGAIILDGCMVGEKVFGAAGVVIHENVPDGVLVGGVPAKVLARTPIA